MNMNRYAVVLTLLLGSVCCCAAPVNVACLGDSITHGGRHARGNAYPAQLDKILGDGYKVHNFGKGGIPLARYDKTKECQKALALAVSRHPVPQAMEPKPLAHDCPGKDLA